MNVSDSPMPSLPADLLSVPYLTASSLSGPSLPAP